MFEEFRHNMKTFTTYDDTKAAITQVKEIFKESNENIVEGIEDDEPYWFFEGDAACDLPKDEAVCDLNIETDCNLDVVEAPLEAEAMSIEKICHSRNDD
ncbi:hypothetical protein ACOSP7_014175 [Xanthoceras sorbifolium]